MKTTLVIIFLFIYSLVSRISYIDSIPPLIQENILSLRFLSAISGVLSVVLTFYYFKKRSGKISGLLSAFFMAVSPFAIEQSRVFSRVNLFLPIFIFALTLLQSAKNMVKKLVFSFILIILSFFLLSTSWNLYFQGSFPNLRDFLNNLFFLISTEFLFFKNPTFWSGGVEEFGVVFLSFLPFFIYGIFRLIQKRAINIFIINMVVILISALSPIFPETRLIYLITPFLSYIAAEGAISFVMKKSLMQKVVLIIILLLFAYEAFQFWHFYLVHYPIRINTNYPSINEAF